MIWRGKSALLALRAWFVRSLPRGAFAVTVGRVRLIVWTLFFSLVPDLFLFLSGAGRFRRRVSLFCVRWFDGLVLSFVGLLAS
jgi:hypothetical protein